MTKFLTWLGVYLHCAFRLELRRCGDDFLGLPCLWHRPLLMFTLVASSFTVSSCYVTKLAFHQNNLMNSRQKITDVVADAATDSKLRQRLEFVEEILDYAGNQGLNRAGAYRYFIKTEKPVVSYLVQAAFPDRLESLTWCFPIVGCVPYRGHFDEGERDQAAAALRAQGYDVMESGVGAFSSLGWFDDPIYSAMLNRKDYSLAHLLFHELTHRTYWAPGSVQFNENLAEYVADLLTSQFLNDKGHKALLDEYQRQQQDLATYHQWLIGLKADLQALYKQRQGQDLHTIKAAKAKIFSEYLLEKKPKFIQFDFVGRGEWNNARVLAGSLYSPDLSIFRNAHRCHPDSSVGEFLEKLKVASDQADDGFAALDLVCAAAP